MDLEIISINIDFVIYELKSALNFYVLYEIHLRNLITTTLATFHEIPSMISGSLNYILY